VRDGAPSVPLRRSPALELMTQEVPSLEWFSDGWPDREPPPLLPAQREVRNVRRGTRLNETRIRRVVLRPASRDGRLTLFHETLEVVGTPGLAVDRARDVVV
jgi:hypothetical protein